VTLLFLSGSDGSLDICADCEGAWFGLLGECGECGECGVSGGVNGGVNGGVCGGVSGGESVSMPDGMDSRLLIGWIGRGCRGCC